MFDIADICNKKFQATEPWKARTENPEVAASLIHNLCYVIKDLMIMMNPYMPQYTQKIMSYFGKSIQETKVGMETKPGYTWADLGVTEGLDKLGPTEVYFKPMDQKTMLAFREKFGGKQSERGDNKAKAEKKEKKAKKAEPVVLPVDQQAAFFNSTIELTVAKIVDVKPNPEGEKLYIETLDDGSGTPRTIQSGLRMYLKESDLLGKHVIIASNLAPRTMRGVESRGMLLAGDYKDADGKDCVEVLDAGWAAPGTKVVLEGADSKAAKKADKAAIKEQKRQNKLAKKQAKYELKEKKRQQKSERVELKHELKKSQLMDKIGDVVDHADNIIDIEAVFVNKNGTLTLTSGANYIIPAEDYFNNAGRYDTNDPYRVYLKVLLESVAGVSDKRNIFTNNIKEIKFTENDIIFLLKDSNILKFPLDKVSTAEDIATQKTG